MIPLPLLAFLKSDLFKYLMVALAIVIFLWRVYAAGANSVQDKWDAANEKTKLEIAVLTSKANAVTTKVETVYVDRIKTVTLKGETIVKTIPQYITVTDNAACVIPNGFVRVWNSAIQNIVSDAPNETDRGPAAVSLSEVAENAAINFTTCNKYIEQNAGMKQWIKEQRAINP